MKTHFFNNSQEAQKFIKENNLKFYKLQSPQFFDFGVEVVEDDTFICEICGEETPLICEGSEPNTCAMCMPLPDENFITIET